PRGETIASPQIGGEADDRDTSSGRKQVGAVWVVSPGSARRYWAEAARGPAAAADRMGGRALLCRRDSPAQPSAAPARAGQPGRRRAGRAGGSRLVRAELLAVPARPLHRDQH